MDIHCPYCSGFSGMGCLAKVSGGVRGWSSAGKTLQVDLMRAFFARSITAELHYLTTKLRALNRGLKSNPSLDGPAAARISACAGQRAHDCLDCQRATQRSRGSEEPAGCNLVLDSGAAAPFRPDGAGPLPRSRAREGFLVRPGSQRSQNFTE